MLQSEQSSESVVELVAAALKDGVPLVLTDDKGRIMVIATHNTDNGDGWEREGENAYYFKNFSEKIAYPLAINALVYMMTH